MRLSHNVIRKILPRLIEEEWRRIELKRRPDLRSLSLLCREIDLLHPQIDDEARRPDNVEYPWSDSAGPVEVPSGWKFPVTDKLYTTTGRLLLKAATQLTRNPFPTYPRK
uniref:Uncharacterized protein n=1 Tax=Paracidobacterium acidisoli TaxID=2303751 RepID=A0A372IRV2_9BACT